MSNVIKKVIKNGVEYDIYANGGAAGAGDVNGPSSATNGHLAVFDGTTGKIIKDGGAVPTSKSAASGGTDTSLVTTGEKYTWNNKQDALTTQTAYTTKGTATKVPTITTNTLGQVTTITETNISFPVTSVNSNTGAVTVNEVPAGGTEGQVLTKGSSGYSWATPASGGIENVTSGTTTTVTGIRCGTEGEYEGLSSKSGTVLYFTFEGSGGGTTLKSFSEIVTMLQSNATSGYAELNSHSSEYLSKFTSEGKIYLYNSYSFLSTDGTSSGLIQDSVGYTSGSYGGTWEGFPY